MRKGLGDGVGDFLFRLEITTPSVKFPGRLSKTPSITLEGKSRQLGTARAGVAFAEGALSTLGRTRERIATVIA